MEVMGLLWAFQVRMRRSGLFKLSLRNPQKFGAAFKGFDFFAQAFVFGALKVGVNLHEPLGTFFRLHQNVHIFDDVGKFQVGQTMLSRSQKFAWTAKAQIVFGDDEPVISAGHHPQPLPRFVR
jgi:hypothetical protein